MLGSFSFMQYAVITFSFWKNTLKQPSTGINFFQLNALYSNYGLKEQLFKGYYTHSIFPRQNTDLPALYKKLQWYFVSIIFSRLALVWILGTKMLMICVNKVSYVSSKVSISKNWRLDQVSLIAPAKKWRLQRHSNQITSKREHPRQTSFL